MPASTAVNSFGTLVRWKGTVIANVTDITPIGLTRVALDVTHQQSTGRWMEKIKGIKEATEVSFTIQYNDSEASHNAVTGILNDFTLDSGTGLLEIIFPDADVWSCQGFVTSFQPSTPVNGIVTASVTFQPTAVPTF